MLGTEYRVPPDLHETLTNWARWAKARHWQSHCRSIEHRYAGELGDVWEEARTRWPVDMLEAWRVESMWRTKLPLKERLIVKSEYISAPVVTREGKSGDAYRMHVYRTCRQLGIHFKRYPAEVYRSTMMLRRAIQR